MPKFGPVTPFSQDLHKLKYRLEGETFEEFVERFSNSVSDSESHYENLLDIIGNQRFMPAGRVQLATGNPSKITTYNCLLGGKISDSMIGIMDELKNCAITLRMGGGCGWDFSTLRPLNDPINGLGGVPASGPVSFMKIWDALCSTIMSQGLRRGAMMAALRVDHPDIMKFIHAKRDEHSLKNFNMSVAVTDKFMMALEKGEKYSLKFNGKVYEEVYASEVWDAIMENNWDYAEPGVLFIDQFNKMHPLGYVEYIPCTNPCGEQGLTYNDACLLGSFNMTKYVQWDKAFDFEQFVIDIDNVIRAMDNVIDISNLPLQVQDDTVRARRRMGLGVTGMANALELMGHSYASEKYIRMQESILEILRDTSYLASADLAYEKGSFELFDFDKWVNTGFAKTLPYYIIEKIRINGLRNALLLSIAPTGTISLCADNISSGIEPPFMMEGTRTIKVLENGLEIKKDFILQDWLYRTHGIKSKTADQISAEDHVRVLCSAQKYIDSAVSKTCNIGDNVTFEEFKDIYVKAWRGGAKGCTTFRPSGKRFGIMQSADKESSCTFNPETGMRTCEE